MNINNLYFYDKNGFPYNFESVTDSNINSTYLYKEIYIKPVSTSLFDNENIFILEKSDDINLPESERYLFPKLNHGETLLFKWDTEKVPEFFLYDVISNGSEPYINPIDYFEFNEVFDNVRLPLQINIAFSPSSETSFEKTLIIYFRDVNGVESVIAKIYFYGEGLDEDERFRIHLENFGIKFNKTDALVLKDYDITEALPDWEDVNDIRKHLIINKEEIFPYVGTYYGLKNFIDILGYKDVIDIKEYWKNIDETSEYLDKYLLVSISNMLNEGKIDELNLVENNKNIKFNDSFTKTGFLALAYQFNTPTGKYDSNGLPILKESSEFTPTEMFYKLNKLKYLLEETILPVNVQIKDVIGEWSYFISFSKLIWHDDLDTTNIDLNIDLNIDILPKSSSRQMYDLSTFYMKKYINGIDFPIFTYNNAIPNFSLINQNYIKETELNSGIFVNDIQTELTLIEYINQFYNDLLPKDFNSIKTNDYEYTDDGMKPIGCPVILSLNIDDLKIQDLDNITFEDIFNYTVETLGLNNLPNVTIDNFTGTFEDFITSNFSHEVYQNVKSRYELLNYTWERIKYLNSFEIEWYVKYIVNDVNTNPFEFKFRGLVKDMFQCPVILPNVGFYDVSVKIYDFYGCMSYKYDNKKIEVKSSIPEICALHIGDDKYNFSVENLSNVRIEDFGTSIPLNPRVNTTNMKNTDIDIDSSLIDVSRFFDSIKTAEIYDPELNSWDEISSSSNPNVINYGYGKRRALRFADFEKATVEDLFHIRPTDCILSSEYLAGFYIKNAEPGDKIRIGYNIDNGYNEYIIPTPTSGTATQDWICQQLNESNNPIISLFYYFVYPKYDYEFNSNIGFEFNDEISTGETYILATAKDFIKESFQYLDFVDAGNGYSIITGSKFTFNAPEYGFDKTLNFYKNMNISNPELLSTLLPQEADNYEYLVNNDIMYVANNTTQHGHVPVLWYDNYLNVQTCKIHKNSFVVPRFKHVFFIINNIPAKISYYWRIINNDTKEDVIIVRNTPVLIYNFDELGSYTIYFETYDKNGNKHINTIESFVNVLCKNEYLQKVEYMLDHNI